MIKNLAIYYFNLLAKIKLSLFFKGEIIALGGCYGKSSAITFLEQVLLKKYKVRSTNIDGKGLNSESGIPFIILGINPDNYKLFDWIKYFFLSIPGFFKKIDAEILLLEMGVDKPDDMKFLTKFYKPNIGILINSNNTHSANFENLHKDTGKSYEELIAFENGYIFENAKEAVFYNLEDPEVIKQVSRFKGSKKVGYSSAKSSITKFDQSLSGTGISFNYKNKDFNLTYPTPLLHEYKSTFELGLKIAEYLKIEAEQFREALSEFNLPPSRCQIFKGQKNTFILDSSYNSSFVPAASALSLLSKISTGRKMAILGDMRELGELTEKEHQKLALEAVKHSDIVITVGPQMIKYFEPEFKVNQRSNQIFHSFETAKDALEFIQANDYSFLQKDDVILIKGSQNTLFLEIIVEDLLQNKDDVNKLCRRDKMYEAKRQELLA